jgi:hypothetical protein
MIVDCLNDDPPDYNKYRVRVERTGEILGDRIFYADDEAGFFDRYTTWPPTVDPENPDGCLWERVHCCIKIVPTPPGWVPDQGDDHVRCGGPVHLNPSHHEFSDA